MNQEQSMNQEQIEKNTLVKKTEQTLATKQDQDQSQNGQVNNLLETEEIEAPVVELLKYEHEKIEGHGGPEAPLEVETDKLEIEPELINKDGLEKDVSKLEIINNDPKVAKDKMIDNGTKRYKFPSVGKSANKEGLKHGKRRRLITKHSNTKHSKIMNHSKAGNKGTFSPSKSSVKSESLVLNNSIMGASEISGREDLVKEASMLMSSIEAITNNLGALITSAKTKDIDVINISQPNFSIEDAILKPEAPKIKEQSGSLVMGLLFRGTPDAGKDTDISISSKIFRASILVLLIMFASLLLLNIYVFVDYKFKINTRIKGKPGEFLNKYTTLYINKLNDVCLTFFTILEVFLRIDDKSKSLMKDLFIIFVMLLVIIQTKSFLMHYKFMSKRNIDFIPLICFIFESIFEFIKNIIMSMTLALAFIYVIFMIGVATKTSKSVIFNKIFIISVYLVLLRCLQFINDRSMQFLSRVINKNKDEEDIGVLQNKCNALIGKLNLYKEHNETVKSEYEKYNSLIVSNNTLATTTHNKLIEDYKVRYNALRETQKRLSHILQSGSNSLNQIIRKDLRIGEISEPKSEPKVEGNAPELPLEVKEVVAPVIKPEIKEGPESQPEVEVQSEVVKKEGEKELIVKIESGQAAPEVKITLPEKESQPEVVNEPQGIKEGEKGVPAKEPDKKPEGEKEVVNNEKEKEPKIVPQKNQQ